MKLIVQGDIVKSLNIKRIASIAAGAALVGAAFAAAATVDAGLGSYKFFNNGEPNVKIVVGSNAAVSDAIAAANIAAMIGNLAYADEPLTVDTSGLSVAGGSSGTASVSGKSVKLEFTTPSGSGMVAAGSIPTQKVQFFGALDYRVTTANSTRQASTAVSSLVGDGVSSGGFKVSGTSYSDVAFKGKVENVGTYSVEQEEFYFLTGNSYYDVSSKSLTAYNLGIVYVTNFTNSLPFHVDTVNGSVNIPTDDADKLANLNVKVKFLGVHYTVTSFENATNPVSITLGQDAISSKQMKESESLTIGDKKLVLKSISPIATSGNLPYAYFELYNSADALVDTFSMSSSTSDYNKNGIILDVRDVFVGGGDASYVLVSIYSAALQLTSGSTINFIGQDSRTKANQDEGWTVTITNQSTVVGSNAINSIKSIQVASSLSSKVAVGGSLKILADPVAKQLTFTGLQNPDSDDLTISSSGTYGDYKLDASAAEVTGVNMTTLTSKTKSFNVGSFSVDTIYIDKWNGNMYYKDSTNGSIWLFNSTATNDNVITYEAPTTSLSGAIQLYTTGTMPALGAVQNTSVGANSSTGMNATHIFVVTYTDAAGGQSKEANITIPVADMTGRMNDTWINWTSSPKASLYQVYNGTGGNFTMVYNGTSTNFYVGNCTRTTTASWSGSSTRQAKLRIFERATQNDNTARGYWDIDLFPTDPNYLFNSSTTILNEPYYSFADGIGTSLYSTNVNRSVEAGYISPGGSVLKTLELSKAVIQYPKELRYALWDFGSPSTSNVTATVEGMVSTESLPEAGYKDLGSGYKVKVVSINASASATGGAAGDISGTASVLAGGSEVTSAAVVKALSASDKLVILDTNAAATSTDQLIVVGGPYVNSVAAGLPDVGDAASWKAGDVYVKDVGGKVLVAGYSAADTTDAANALIAWLSSKRDEIRG